MEGKKSFILYSDLISIVNQLPDEQAGKLFKIILEYVNDKEIDIDDLLLKIAFEPIRKQLKRDLEKWEGIKEKRKEAGKKGGRPKKEVQLEEKEENQTEAKKANGFFENQTKAKKAVSVNDNVNVNVNDILLEKESKEREEKIPDKIVLENAFKPPEENLKRKKVSTENEKVYFNPPNLQEVQNYCNERNNGISANAFVSYYQSIGWMIGKNKMKDWKSAVRTWEQKRKEESNGKQKKQAGRSLSINR